MSKQVAVLKKDAKQRLVFGEVYAPNRPDSDGEFMVAESITKMAYKFMRERKLNKVDSMHSNVLVDGASVVESFIARKGDPDFIEGAWVVGVHIPKDEDWEKVEKGEWNGFSIEAMVTKVPVDVTIELPPIISGKTMKSGEVEHIHSFHVAYDEHGRFLGGKTDTVEGHYHTIKRGTMTDEASSHTHRFSHIEDVMIQ